MPCKSDYLASNHDEKEMSKVVALIDELDGKGAPDPKTYGNGYDKRVYNKGWTKEAKDELVASLCARLQKVRSIKKYSLELQTWWRDHQEADRERLDFELRQKKNARDRKRAIAKLSPYERKLLGIE